MILRACAWLLLSTGLAFGAERHFDFSSPKAGALPEGWTPELAGGGRPGEWKVVEVEMPSALEPLSPQARPLNRKPALAQTAPSAEDERFPMLIHTAERYGDFTFTARFRIEGGAFEQIAGLVFRHQDPKNFYVVRASALGGNLRFYKFVDGERSVPIGPAVPFRRGEWYELSVRAEGNQIEVFLNGTNALPTLTDNSFNAGHIGFITKSDTTAVFSDAGIRFRPLETLAASLVRQTLEQQSRLLDLRLYGPSGPGGALRCLAAKNPADVGREPSGETVRKVLLENQVYYGKTPQAAVVTAPLHDRNGDVVGVMEFHLKPFAGQIESTTVARVLPTLKKLESGITGTRGLTD
ncbi:MAG: family 16 glycoside hydrolase [Verrucomicrobiota bacterium]